MARIASSLSAKTAATTGRYAEALAIFNARPTFVEDADGYRIRVWSDQDISSNDNVTRWLKGVKVVEDLREGLEYVKQSTIDRLIKEGSLRKVGLFYWVTADAAVKYSLPRIPHHKFPK